MKTKNERNTEQPRYCLIDKSFVNLKKITKSDKTKKKQNSKCSLLKVLSTYKDMQELSSTTLQKQSNRDESGSILNWR